jgi:hypothetical protein
LPTFQEEMLKITLPELNIIPEASKRGSSLYFDSPDSPLRGAK